MTSLRQNYHSPYIMTFHAIVFFGVVAFLLLRCEPLPRCTSDNDCARPLRCESGRCQASCLVNTDCNEGKVCQNLQCVYPNSITTPDSQPSDQPISCEYESKRQEGSTITVSLRCNGTKTQVTYTKEQAKPCEACKDGEVCVDGTCWRKGSQQNPGSSCQDIQQAYTGNPKTTPANGTYWIKHPNDSNKTLRVYCDMETAGGGWTLCLNSRYTQEASQKLFVTSYQKVFPPSLAPGQEPDPFDTYDFCPTNRETYRMTLAKSPGLQFSHGIVDFSLTQAKPLIQIKGEEQYYGVQSSKGSWITKPLDFNVENESPPREIRFWWYHNNSSQNKPDKDKSMGIFRGFAKLSSSTTSEKIWLGAGCYNYSCFSPTAEHHSDRIHGENQVTLLASYIRWTNAEEPTTMVKGFRVQVYFR